MMTLRPSMGHALREDGADKAQKCAKPKARVPTPSLMTLRAEPTVKYRALLPQWLPGHFLKLTLRNSKIILVSLIFRNRKASTMIVHQPKYSSICNNLTLVLDFMIKVVIMKSQPWSKTRFLTSEIKFPKVISHSMHWLPHLSNHRTPSKMSIFRVHITKKRCLIIKHQINLTLIINTNMSLRLQLKSTIVIHTPELRVHQNTKTHPLAHLVIWTLHTKHQGK